MAVITAFPGGEAPASIPEFTYTGNYTFIDDGDDNWRIKFLTSGTFTITNDDFDIDAFLVGGGGGGGWRGAGAGGYTTLAQVTAVKDTGYSIVIGAGGGYQASGGQTSAFSNTANGGQGGQSDGSGGDGGSGGAGWNGDGGSNGGNGTGQGYGYGQGTTTREFHEATGDLYSPGGAGDGGTPGTGLTGANSGRGNNYDTVPGYSGIVVIRNRRAA